jgi:hypothetical protein
VRGTAFAASLALPAALVVWLPSGPLGSDWAQRAGTPASVLAKTGGSSAASSAGSGSSGTASTVGAFQAAVSGTVRQSETTNGIVSVNIDLSVANAQLPAMALEIVGEESGGGGVQMTSSSVSAGSAAEPDLFTGEITSLQGTDIAARVSSAAGQVLDIAVALQINGSGTATGTVQVTPAQ